MWVMKQKLGYSYSYVAFFSKRVETSVEATNWGHFLNLNDRVVVPFDTKSNWLDHQISWNSFDVLITVKFIGDNLINSQVFQHWKFEYVTYLKFEQKGHTLLRKTLNIVWHWNWIQSSWAYPKGDLEFWHLAQLISVDIIPHLDHGCSARFYWDQLFQDMQTTWVSKLDNNSCHLVWIRKSLLQMRSTTSVNAILIGKVSTDEGSNHMSLVPM